MTDIRFNKIKSTYRLKAIDGQQFSCPALLFFCLLERKHKAAAPIRSKFLKNKKISVHCFLGRLLGKAKYHTGFVD